MGPSNERADNLLTYHMAIKVVEQFTDAQLVGVATGTHEVAVQSAERPNGILEFTLDIVEKL